MATLIAEYSYIHISHFGIIADLVPQVPFIFVKTVTLYYCYTKLFQIVPILW